MISEKTRIFSDGKCDGKPFKNTAFVYLQVGLVYYSS